MREGTASFTAQFPAIMRAAHQVLDGRPKILDDPLAIGFVEGVSEDEINASLKRYQSPPLIQARAWFVLRHRFAEDSLAQGLAQSTFDLSAPAFFSWLGVTMYLEREAVFNSLQDILSLPPSSQVVFDFELDDKALQGQVKRSIAKASASSARRGEPWKSRFKAQKLQTTMLDMGFNDVTYFNGPQAEERYFSGRDDGLSLGGTGHMMLARV